MELNEDSKNRIKEALSYNNSSDRELYTSQRIPNNRNDILKSLKDGVELSSVTGRYKKVSKILMKK